MRNSLIILAGILAVGCSANAAYDRRRANSENNTIKTAAVKPAVEAEASAADTVVTDRWKKRVETLLSSGDKVYKRQGKEAMILFFARSFIGIPYVAHTLDKSDEEKLVVNLDGLDCTTYVENVATLSLCVLKGKFTYADYRKMLTDLRYRGGKLSYENRLHYYEWWVEDNERMGFVKQIDSPDPPFSGRQKLETDYMTTHASAYDMLRNNPERVKALSKLEQLTQGKTVKFIPKTRIDNSSLLRNTVHDGDIIAITTNKRGLDTTHLGIAVWHKDGLHLLNASALSKNGHKVVEADESLSHYLSSRSWNPGIRVARIM